jgi:Ca-activated chloride channel homolog
VQLVQIAPGVYEVPLGEIDSGAYAVRVTQTRPGSTPLGRTVGLVAPTAAEYRQLGSNDPFLTALRTATGGEEIVAATDPWIHDLRTTSRSTDLWPLLLMLALLLWPLDIALRRVSIGRREFAAAGAWVRELPRRRRATAARTATGESLLAARARATSSETRAALRRQTEVAPAAPVVAPPPTPVVAQPAAPPAVPITPPPTESPGHAPSPEPAGDTLSRLRDAKRRARER